VIQRWWEKWPERLEFELRCLVEAGIAFRFDEQARAAGIVKLLLHHRVNGEDLDLTAIFPDLYPYFRFEVQAPSLTLKRHQHPAGGTLCLIGRATANWSSSNTLAGAITGQLPSVLKAARAPQDSASATIEEHQGEPATDYFPYANDLAILVDSDWSVRRDFSRGLLTLGIKADFRNRSAPRLQAIVKQVKDSADTTTLAQADSDLASCFEEEIQARWVRLGAPPPLLAPDDLVHLLSISDANLLQPEWRAVGGGRIDVIGVVFPEEVGYQTTADGWLFVLRLAKPGTNGKQGYSCYVRGLRGGRRDMSGRIPELAPLSKATVVVAGLGALGAPSAVDMARAGVGELRLLDCDFVDPGTTARYPLGLQAAGLQKTTALPEFLAANYPFTKVRMYPHRIGSVRDAADPVKPDPVLLEAILDGANLVYDATAEIGIQHALSDLARRKGIPYICVSATEGAWGGLVARIRPGKTEGCWYCLMHHIDTRSIPPPPRNPTGTVQPIGCANPTFTGAGFDLAEIALAGTRLAVATLCADHANAYSDCEWDIARISLRDETGRTIAPHYETFALKAHPKCESCRNASAA